MNVGRINNIQRWRLGGIYRSHSKTSRWNTGHVIPCTTPTVRKVCGAWGVGTTDACRDFRLPKLLTLVGTSDELDSRTPKKLLWPGQYRTHPVFSATASWVSTCVSLSLKPHMGWLRNLWIIIYQHDASLLIYGIPINSRSNENRVWIAWVDFLQTKYHSSPSLSSEIVNMSTLFFFLGIAILSMWLDSIQWMWVKFKCIKSLPTIYPMYLILHFNVTIIVWWVPQLNASTFFFTLASSSVAKPSLALHPCLVPRNLYLLSSLSEAIKSHFCVESTIKLICIIIFQCSKL